MARILAVICLGALVACTSEVPDSGAGVGFGGYSEYEAQRAEREALLVGSIPTPSSTQISDEYVSPGTPLPTTATGQTTVTANNAGISDEQDFSAVSSRQSIESDRERLDAQSDAYQVVQPTALPARSGGSEISVVDYALATSNRLGEQVYGRSGGTSEARFTRNCAKYASSDMAQVEFLKSGGPHDDRKGLDPDGDGFACFWDPTPFRQAVNR